MLHHNTGMKKLNTQTNKKIYKEMYISKTTLFKIDDYLTN